ncbi:MAG: hypothetical protein ABJL72_08020 [Roseobacter sp.]
MRNLLIATLICAGMPVLAADWAVRPSDRVLTRQDVETLTSGNTLVFYDEGRSTYSEGGAYSYTYASGQSAYGNYEITQDGTVCITYRHGAERCDRYVESGPRIVLLTEDGLRFPVRPVEKK